MPIAFDTTGFQQQDQHTWINQGNGDRISLSRHDGAPDLPAGLDDLPRLRHELAVRHGEVGCLIEAQVVQLGGHPALLQIVKLPMAGPGQTFSCTVIMQGAGSYAVLSLVAEERGTTGMREGVLAAEVGYERWVLPHPYAPQLQSRLPFHAGDDPRFDGRFPQHPLSRVRAWVHRLVRSAQVDPAFVTPAAPDPAAFFSGGPLMTAICGVPVAGYVALQIGERTTYWKTLGNDLQRRLARGTLGRSPLSDGRFREMVMVDEQSGNALMMDRFMTDGASLGVQLNLQQVSREEAYAAVTREALEEAYRWVGRMIEVASGRNEYLTLEPIVHQGERVEPFAMMATQHHEGEDIVLVSCAPAPSENTPFKGGPGMNAVISPAAFRGIGVLAMQAMLEWGPHPLDMAITFTRYGGTVESEGTPESLTDDVRTLFTGSLAVAVPGVAIGGHVALQQGERRTYWRLPDNQLADELGFGRLARHHSPGHRFRDVVLLDEQSGDLLVPDRYGDDSATRGRKITLVRVSAEEALAAATQEACHEAFQRVGRAVYSAARRGELIFVELLENELRQDPYVFLGVQDLFDDDPVAVASAAPAPSANTQFNGKPTLEAPASAELVVGLGLLALQAINDWGVHPLHVVPTYHRPTR